MSLIAYHFILLIYFSYVQILYFLSISKYRNQINLSFQKCVTIYTVIIGKRSNSTIYIPVYK